MSFDLVSEDKAAKAAEEYAEQLHEIYKHECYGTKKKECKLYYCYCDYSTRLNINIIYIVTSAATADDAYWNHAYLEC